jgi:hypothetical protein
MHGPHQLAQKSTTTMRPLSRSIVTAVPSVALNSSFGLSPTLTSASAEDAANAATRNDAITFVPSMIGPCVRNHP